MCIRDRPFVAEEFLFRLMHKIDHKIPLGIAWAGLKARPKAVLQAGLDLTLLTHITADPKEQQAEQRCCVRGL